MSAGLSVHAIDIAGGRPAQGLVMDLLHLLPDGSRATIMQGKLLDANGKCALFDTGTGCFEARFHVADYYAAQGMPQDGFMPVVRFRFGIADAGRHHHLPLKFTPCGFSLFLTH